MQGVLHFSVFNGSQALPHKRTEHPLITFPSYLYRFPQSMNNIFSTHQLSTPQGIKDGFNVFQTISSKRGMESSVTCNNPSLVCTTSRIFVYDCLTCLQHSIQDIQYQPHVGLEVWIYSTSGPIQEVLDPPGYAVTQPLRMCFVHLPVPMSHNVIWWGAPPLHFAMGVLEQAHYW